MRISLVKSIHFYLFQRFQRSAYRESLCIINSRFAQQIKNFRIFDRLYSNVKVESMQHFGQVFNKSDGF